MISLGLKIFTLTDGYKLDVKTFYRGYISKNRTEEAHDWLRDNDHADLIKNDVICSYGKGEDHDALVLMGKLEEMNVDYENRKSVHPSTLKAFVREQINEGSELPMDTFGVFVGAETKISKT